MMFIAIKILVNIREAYEKYAWFYNRGSRPWKGLILEAFLVDV